MRTVKIFRIPEESGDQGTFGSLTTDSGFQCYTGELPWRENKSNISCIPPGSYICTKAMSSPKFGKCYHVQGCILLGGRTNILIHKGNFCGDTSKGFKTDVQGCILLGRAIGEIAGHKALLGSKDALRAFEADLEGADFELTIDVSSSEV